MARNQVNYEWVIEYTDEHGDIQDHERDEKLANITGNWYDNLKPVLVLVRDEGNDVEGLLDRCWCYPKDGTIPTRFSNEWGHEINTDVPKKYLKEYEKSCLHAG